MTVIILDTNVISELMKPEPDRNVARWLGALNSDAVFVTSVTEAEIRSGLALLPDGKRLRQLRSAVDETFARDFEDRVLVFDSAAASAYGRIMAGRRAMGKPITVQDAMIAAIATSVGAELATRNVRDFQDCGVQVVNPWTD